MHWGYKHRGHAHENLSRDTVNARGQATFHLSRALYTRQVERGRISRGTQLRSVRGRGSESKKSMPSSTVLGPSFIMLYQWSCRALAMLVGLVMSVPTLSRSCDSFLRYSSSLVMRVIWLLLCCFLYGETGSSLGTNFRLDNTDVPALSACCASAKECSIAYALASMEGG